MIRDVLGLLKTSLFIGCVNAAKAPTSFDTQF